MAKCKDEILQYNEGDQRTGRVLFFCPACQDYHAIKPKGADGTGWGFNGDYNLPTFTPSVLYRSGHHVPGHTGECWCDWQKKHPKEAAPFSCTLCHSFVTDGRIQFLSDCTHAMAGQTVDLPDI